MLDLSLSLTRPVKLLNGFMVLNSLCQYTGIGSANNIRKFRIDIGIQLPEKYKDNFDVSSEGPSSRYMLGVKILSILPDACLCLRKPFLYSNNLEEQ